MINPKLFTSISHVIRADFDNLNSKIVNAIITDSITDNRIRFTVFAETVIDITSSLTDVTATITPINNTINCHHSRITYTSVIVDRDIFFFLDGHPAGLFGGRKTAGVCVPQATLAAVVRASPKHSLQPGIVEELNKTFRILRIPPVLIALKKLVETAPDHPPLKLRP